MFSFYSSILLFTSIVAAADPRLTAGLEKRDCDPGEYSIRNTLTIINATPYGFQSTGRGSCQISDWNWAPDYVAPGDTVTFHYGVTRGGDAAADISYQLKMGDKLSPKTFSIHVQGKDQLVGYTISASVSGGLSTQGHGSDPNIRWSFGDYEDYNNPQGADVFVLSGDETYGYGTIQPPTAWMSEMGPQLKKLSINQLVIPASHDSGMSMAVGGIGDSANSQTQDVGVYEQLRRGERMLDIRPFLNAMIPTEYILGHFSGGLGAYGQSLLDVISDINKFNHDYPGELIILDLNAGFQTIDTFSQPDFTTDQFNAILSQLTKYLNGLDTTYHLKSSTGPGKLAGEPISTFYESNPSPVFVRLPVGKWHGDIPSSDGKTTTGVVSSDFLPIASRWPDTNDPQVLKDQAKAQLDNRDPNSAFMSVFLLTLKDIQNVSLDSIHSLAIQARAVIFDNVFRWSSQQKYPNMIQHDYVLNGDVAAIAAAMNYYYAFPNIKG